MAVQAVIQTGGKQYLVSEGDVIAVEKLSEPKQTLTPLMVTADGKAQSAAKAKVSASVLDEEIKGEKLVVFKMKAKKGSRKKTGHRQTFSQLRIDKITV
jgi:large subunit ribosomal protein L21